MKWRAVAAAAAVVLAGCENMSEGEQQAALIGGLGALAVGAAILAGSDDSSGSSGGGGGNVIRLESVNDRFNNYRLTGNQRGAEVQLVRQISSEPCRFGRTWGYDYDEIWVDDGCRAEFRIRGQGGNQGSNQTVVRVESHGGSYQVHRLPRDWWGSEIRLERQLSSADCRRDRSWGYDGRDIWVDDGCRAEFALRRS